MVLASASGCHATDGSGDTGSNLAGSYLTGVKATDDENSTSAAKVALTGTPSFFR